MPPAVEEGDSRDPSWSPRPVPVDWLWNVLTVGGPAERVEAFRAAAAGPGVVPWTLDLAAMEEEFLLPMAAPPDGVRAISLAGAKILARRLRDAAAANHQAALARMATDRTCPFDLHRLLPVPPAILALGPEEGESRGWLRAHWGVARPLRHGQVLPSTLDGRRKRMGQLRVGFWSADWSPWAAVARLRRAWPGLSFELQPHYPGGAGKGTAEPAGDGGHITPVREGTGRKARARAGIRRDG
ncbi:hypothetical protein [Roseomonas indoligenes]|uniref:Uncharacterized protein n=1 Tax=Roseomonas indoligenes TaxID=2820811 RepID=A0A940N2S8_9PROT|nr:hypothetical protein [Pararoseomonas indoligenes]MBP0495692.1 hypothetical protein [Pararoseomonas indoligenes]